MNTLAARALVALLLLPVAAVAKKVTKMDAEALNAQAEPLLMNGDLGKGVPLLLQALDADPLHAGALDNLDTVAGMHPDRFGDELLKRLGTAAAKAEGAARSDLSWSRTSEAVFLNKLDLVTQLAGNGSLANPARAAQLGSLLVEIGKAAEGEKILRSTPTALANYHLARLADRAGHTDEARRLFMALPAEGGDGVLREIGLAALALKAGGADATKPAKALFTRAENLELDKPVVSEGILLRIRVALAEHNQADAAYNASRMGAGASTQDPSAMLRAAALVGPLYKVELKP